LTIDLGEMFPFQENLPMIGHQRSSGWHGRPVIAVVVSPAEVVG
jgi:hypothetical protein